MSGLTGNYTVTYSESSQGFPSFYSYFPDMMIGMNNYLYSFKGGDLYRHNTNEIRNNYYDVQYDSTIKSVINERPLENKLFKTIMLESDSAWTGTFISDQQTTGSISADWFVKKEGAWYAFMRNTGATPAGANEYPLRSLNGISSSQTVNSAAPAAVEINFSSVTSIGSILSIGDTLYFIASPVVANSTPVLCGTVTAVNINLPAGVNQIVVDTSAGTIPPGQTDYFLFIKNQIAESHGILGHYCEFTLTNTDTTATELFAVETEVMKSFP